MRPADIDRDLARLATPQRAPKRADKPKPKPLRHADPSVDPVTALEAALEERRAGETRENRANRLGRLRVALSRSTRTAPDVNRAEYR